MQSIFITGTDTGVGKTVVTAALLAGARERGIDAIPMKPVQTGCVRRASGLRAQDLDVALRQAELKPSDRERAQMAPYRFLPAVSPHWAAAEAGVEISLSRIVDCFRRLRARHEAVLVEGAGGVLVPLNKRETMRDLMCALGLPVLLVARPSLGTLNHTLLSLEGIRSAGLSVAGVVLNAAAPGCSARMVRSNAKALRSCGNVRVAGPIPYRRDLMRREAGTRFRRETRAVARTVLDWIQG